VTLLVTRKNISSYQHAKYLFFFWRKVIDFQIKKPFEAKICHSNCNCFFLQSLE
jgi:hypothetical protein